MLVDGDRLVLIDLPQVVDVVGNPQGPAFLARDVRQDRGLVRRTRGLPAAADAAAALLEDLCADLHIPRAGRSGTTSHVREGHTDRR